MRGESLEAGGGVGGREGLGVSGGIQGVVFGEEEGGQFGEVGELFGFFANEREDGGERGKFREWEACFLEEGEGELEEAFRRGLEDVLAVEPEAFFEVEVSVLAVDFFEVKEAHSFLEGEDFAVVFGGPPEEGEVIANGVREVAFLEVGGDAGARVALAHLRAVLVQDEGDVGVARGRLSEGFEEFEMFGRVGEVIFAANDVGDLHFDVIDDIDEVEDPGAIGSADGHVGMGVRVGEIEFDIAADEVVDGDFLAQRAEAPGALILVEVALGVELIKVGLVDGFAFGLEIGAAGSADFWAFIPLEAEPAEAFEDDLDGLLSVAGFVGVFDAEDEGAAAMAGEEPVEEGGSGAADVQVTGGGGGEANADVRTHKGVEGAKGLGGRARENRAGVQGVGEIQWSPRRIQRGMVRRPMAVVARMIWRLKRESDW